MPGWLHHLRTGAEVRAARLRWAAVGVRSAGRRFLAGLAGELELCAGGVAGAGPATGSRGRLFPPVRVKHCTTSSPVGRRLHQSMASAEY